MKIIFLDIDGVLNGYNYLTLIAYKTVKFFHLSKLYTKIFQETDIEEKRVKRLSKIIQETNAKVVLSSSRRKGLLKEYEELKEKPRYIVDMFKKYNIEIIDGTPRIPFASREDEIRCWLEENKDKNIESFVILDDEKFDFDRLYEKQFVMTSKNGEIMGHWGENTGLKNKHIKQAIRILNKPNYP